MTWMPFVCLGAGLLISLKQMSEKMLKLVDYTVNIALVILMVTIGLNIGINDSVMLNLATIGFHCVVISLLAIFFSILLVVLVEKTILPLEKLKEKLYHDNVNVNQEIHIEEEEKTSPLIWIMPISICLGVLSGYLIFPEKYSFLLDYLLLGSLILLYTGVGISLGNNRGVFKYLKALGFKVIYLSLAIFIGSLTGGVISGILLKLPFNISVISASGMSYYSITGAYMTQCYGIEAGTYGFVVNVMREFFTVLLLPLFVKISKGSPIAGGAAGNMDTMLIPVTKFVGPELGLVALITGVILTFAVPVILPVLYGIMLAQL